MPLCLLVFATDHDHLRPCRVIEATELPSDGLGHLDDPPHTIPAADDHDGGGLHHQTQGTPHLLSRALLRLPERSAERQTVHVNRGLAHTITQRDLPNIFGGQEDTIGLLMKPHRMRSAEVGHDRDKGYASSRTAGKPLQDLNHNVLVARMHRDYEVWIVPFDGMAEGPLASYIREFLGKPACHWERAVSPSKLPRPDVLRHPHILLNDQIEGPRAVLGPHVADRDVQLFRVEFLQSICDRLRRGPVPAASVGD
mmetsp:Transcript_43/g.142  ORF Transcript_43/g.142 Transcript_43/m.142 type:complete len:254 (-) Transcript_43:256-1017(-)